jgi:hypothetical protein
MRERNRLQRLKTDRPQMMYLVEALSHCARSLHVEAPFEIPNSQKRTPYEHEDLGFQLS